MPNNITTPKNNGTLKYIMFGITLFSILVSFFVFKDKVNYPQASNITILENSKFLNRTKIIKDIDKALRSKIGLAVIIGEGGAGKTIIARKYLKSIKNALSLGKSTQNQKKVF